MLDKNVCVHGGGIVPIYSQSRFNLPGIDLFCRKPASYTDSFRKNITWFCLCTIV